MYFRLTEALKQRFIDELRRFWSYHPRYNGSAASSDEDCSAVNLVDNIQGKFSFEEQAQYGIIVKTGSGSHVSLSPDNYVGVVESYVYKALVQNYPGVAVEWVREDAIAIQNNGGSFPSAPGVYYIELTEDTEFYVDPLLDVYNEQVMMTDTTTGQIQHPFLAGSLRLYEQPNGFLLQEPGNYTSDASTGAITLINPLTNGRYLVADYRYPGETSGPHVLTPMMADHKAIPGVVVAFGRRNKKGDRIAVVVQDRRKPAALEYGGRWELTLDFDVMARDVYDQQEIADYSVIYLWGVARSRMSSEGIEIKDISLGGESEEIYDENGDDYFYNSSFSITVETDWAIHVPLTTLIRMASSLTLDQAAELANLPDDEASSVPGNIEMFEALGLNEFGDPFFANRDKAFEIIR